MKPEEIDEILDLLKEKIFPKYQENLNRSQKLLIDELSKLKATGNLSDANVINGLIGGMSYASFELAVKLSMVITLALKSSNPIDEIKKMNFDDILFSWVFW